MTTQLCSSVQINIKRYQKKVTLGKKAVNGYRITHELQFTCTHEMKKTEMVVYALLFQRTVGCFGIPNSFNRFYHMSENVFVA